MVELKKFLEKVKTFLEKVYYYTVDFTERCVRNIFGSEKVLRSVSHVNMSLTAHRLGKYFFI